MHWKLKAAIQNAVSWMPSDISYNFYYSVQRYFGGLSHVDPVSRLEAGITTCKLILNQGASIHGKVFFELGTGRIPIVPTAYWLMGAEKTISIDLNPYLKEELILEFIQYLCKYREEVSYLFGDLIDNKRFNDLLMLGKSKKIRIFDYLEACQIEYISPGDASKLDLPDLCIDYHTSYAVLEHIPNRVLKGIIREGNRLVQGDGLFVHWIDYSDHFSHSDQNISAINFLQYSENEWSKYACNRYMYMNRMRHDDFISLYRDLGHRILEVRTEQDQKIRTLIRNSHIVIDSQFSDKTIETLSTINAWVVTRKSS